ncbi:MAG: hypothetical protein ABSB61_06505 [Anaerolineales bacterium]
MKNLLIIAALLALVMSCAPAPPLAPTSTPWVITATPLPTAAPTTTPTATPTATSTPYPTAPPAPSCVRPEDVTLADVGRIITVCGKVSSVGRNACPSCAYGSLSYMVFGSDIGLQVYSYDWNFLPDWVGKCLTIKDKVQRVGSRPVFVLQGNSDVTSCTIGADGQKTCQGTYFQEYACSAANSSAD